MSVRKPRYRRIKITCLTTDRDLEIVRHVARHRFLNTQHLRQLVEGGEQGIARRLQTLYHAGLLDRPKAQLEYFHRGGSKPMVYGLGPQGARLLCARGEKNNIDWTAKNRMTSKLFIEHTLRVADFMVALEIACRKTGLIFHRIMEPSSKVPHWTVPVVQGRLSAFLGVIPDAVFALHAADREPIYYCLEADRATMPIKRRDLHQTSVARKLLAYHATWKNRVAQERYGWNRFRVLTLTTSAARVVHLQEAARALPTGHGLFLFAHEDELRTSPDALSMPWHEPNDRGLVNLLAA